MCGGNDIFESIVVYGDSNFRFVGRRRFLLFRRTFPIGKIVRRAESGERMFVVLDEILRGTNSADKQKGSLGLVGKLVKLPVAGVIATHDLALGSLAETFPKQVRNFRFEADIEGERLTFSYRIRTGVAEMRMLRF